MINYIEGASDMNWRIDIFEDNATNTEKQWSLPLESDLFKTWINCLKKNMYVLLKCKNRKNNLRQKPKSTLLVKKVLFQIENDPNLRLKRLYFIQNRAFITRFHYNEFKLFDVNTAQRDILYT